MPLFFASNAIYPIALMLVNGTSIYGVGLDASILLAVTAMVVLMGARLYPKVVT